MSTLVKENKEQNVDFTGTDKTLDWRYQAWEHIQYTNKNKTIHWLASVDLAELEETNICFLYFLNQGKLAIDRKRYREADGAETGSMLAIKYNLDPVLKEVLATARNKGFNYYHFFVEETVDGHGRHTVCVLYHEKTPEALRYGIATQKPWFQEPFSEWIGRVRTKIPEGVKRIYILSDGSYNWLK